jgi:hypothetical protein
LESAAANPLASCVSLRIFDFRELSLRDWVLTLFPLGSCVVGSGTCYDYVRQQYSPLEDNDSCVPSS